MSLVFEVIGSIPGVVELYFYATFRRRKAAGTPPQFSAAAAEFPCRLLHSMPPTCGGYVGGYAHAIFRRRRHLLPSTAASTAAFY